MVNPLIIGLAILYLIIMFALVMRNNVLAAKH
jgi:hypothetical protein